MKIEFHPWFNMPLTKGLYLVIGRGWADALYFDGYRWTRMLGREALYWAEIPTQAQAERDSMKIEPCGWCGSEAALFDDVPEYVQCTNSECLAEGPLYDSDGAKWNSMMGNRKDTGKTRYNSVVEMLEGMGVDKDIVEEVRRNEWKAVLAALEIRLRELRAMVLRDVALCYQQTRELDAQTFEETLRDLAREVTES